AAEPNSAMTPKISSRLIAAQPFAVWHLVVCHWRVAKGDWPRFVGVGGTASHQPEQANGIAQYGRKHEQDDWCKKPFDWNFVTADRQGKRLDFFQ
ncbi:MAG: hypothetical protein VW665_09710, partial [Candidatus Puniceispirillum sp.]